jgi:hypothetical protein
MLCRTLMPQAMPRIYEKLRRHCWYSSDAYQVTMIHFRVGFHKADGGSISLPRTDDITAGMSETTVQNVRLTSHGKGPSFWLYPQNGRIYFPRSTFHTSDHTCAALWKRYKENFKWKPTKEKTEVCLPANF